MISEVYLQDNIEGMKQWPDKHFELGIVDPEYGIGFSDYERGGSGQKVKERYTKTGKKQWDANIPTEAYFEQLFRVTQNQIIWGGNYFPLPPTQCFIFWYKQNPVPNFADGELAWTSFKRPAVCFDYRYYGNLQGNSSKKHAPIHPTQKPVELYKWTLAKFAKAGDKILDTNVGSGTARVACHELGFDYYGYENDPEIFEKHTKFFKEMTAQLPMAFPV